MRAGSACINYCRASGFSQETCSRTEGTSGFIGSFMQIARRTTTTATATAKFNAAAEPPPRLLLNPRRFSCTIGLRHGRRASRHLDEHEQSASAWSCGINRSVLCIIILILYYATCSRILHCCNQHRPYCFDDETLKQLLTVMISMYICI